MLVLQGDTYIQDIVKICLECKDNGVEPPNKSEMQLNFAFIKQWIFGQKGYTIRLNGMLGKNTRIQKGDKRIYFRLNAA